MILPTLRHHTGARAAALGGPIGAGLLVLRLAAPAGAQCDFNDDGFSDLPVGVPGEAWTGWGGTSSGDGVVHVFYSDSLGVWHWGDELVRGEPEDELGSNVVCGDFNGDGHDDLLLGAPGAFDGSGKVEVHYGWDGHWLTSLGLSGRQVFDQDVPLIRDSREAGDRFGGALASGDFDGDGYDDLVVGVPLEDVGRHPDAGAVQVIYGEAYRIVDKRDDFLHRGGSLLKDNPRALDRFGAALIACDFDGDGADDLAVGVPGAAAAAGSVQVIYGHLGAGLIAHDPFQHVVDQVFRQGEGGLVGTPDPLDGFGESLACGDFDGDGFSDLVVGVPGERVNGVERAGAVAVLYGGGAGLSGNGSQLWHEGLAEVGGAPGASDEFGYSLAAGDFTGDGLADLAVGVPRDGETGVQSAGAVVVLFGAPAGLGAGGHQRLVQELDGERAAEPGDRLGESLFAADFDGNGWMDLAAGLPFEDIGAAEDAGAVHIFAGTDGGLVHWQLWHQDSLFVEDEAEAFDGFGRVATGRGTIF